MSVEAEWTNNPMMARPSCCQATMYGYRRHRRPMRHHAAGRWSLAHFHARGVRQQKGQAVTQPREQLGFSMAGQSRDVGQHVVIQFLMQRSQALF